VHAQNGRISTSSLYKMLGYRRPSIEFHKKRKIKAITAFKVIQGHRGRYQSKARM